MMLFIQGGFWTLVFTKERKEIRKRKKMKKKKRGI